MGRCRYIILAPLSLLAGLLTGCGKMATIQPPAGAIVVAKDGSGEFRSIADALGHARPGETVFVKPGRYLEALELRDVTVTLIGSGPDRTIIDADSEYACLTLVTDGNHVAGFGLTNASSHGIYVQNGHQTIENCLIFGNGDRGVYLSNIFGNGTADINHCTIVDNGVSGIYATDDTAATSITNSIIAFNGRGIVSDGSGGRMKIEFNCLYNRSENFDRAKKGTNNIEADPRFVDRERGDYRLSKGSPCLKAASDGRNMGCFQ